MPKTDEQKAKRKRQSHQKDTPLKITATLLEPIAGDLPMLDALLEWVMSSRWRSINDSSGGRRHFTELRNRGEPVAKPCQLPLPLEKRWVDGLPIWACSSPIADPSLDTQEHVTSQFALDLFGLLDEEELGVLQTTGGAFKSYRLPIRLRLCERVVWFAVGNAKLVRALLRHVDALGKKTAYGYGRVATWSVERVERDWSWFAETEDGRRVLMRPLPDAAVADDVAGVHRTFGGVTCPYWQTNLFRESAVPAE